VAGLRGFQRREHFHGGTQSWLDGRKPSIVARHAPKGKGDFEPNQALGVGQGAPVAGLVPLARISDQFSPAMNP
jgi:hypothetical protein